ncbi:MAG: GNAT family N-acetyltransferase [Clostridiales bacterium]|nr:GNAT family N-acetyltransferase [Clostridiales bacterium]
MNMVLAYEMEYKHPVQERSAVELIPYSSSYQEQYKTLYNECYHEMREALDIKPYDFIQDDSFFDSGMENVYLLVENGEIIGSVALKKDEIDDLIVNRKFQGQGYGKQILLWALEHMKTERVMLHVADWNKRAIELYKKTGFEITGKG